MAYDGIAIASVIHELKALVGGRIDKIAQPESDELIISVRSQGAGHKLLLTANPTHPRLHLTRTTKPSPMQAPMFCMVLRKHLNNGKILDIIQPNFERIVEFVVESFNDLGDLSRKRLIIEVMGKHSNIILVDDRGIILDSIKHISHEKSSVREVLPGREYVLPPSQKENPMLLSEDGFANLCFKQSDKKLSHIIYQSYNGISPQAATEVCHRAGLDPDVSFEMSDAGQQLYNSFEGLITAVKRGEFENFVYTDDKGKVLEFSCFPYEMYDGFERRPFDTFSELLDFFYGAKDQVYRINQKSTDVKKLVQMNIERCAKKKSVYIQTLKEIENRDRHQLFGELLTSYMHLITKGQTSFTAENYYDNTTVEIPLDPTLSPIENAQRYFKRYSKEKRAFAALEDQLKQNDEELEYLETVMNAVQTSTDEADIEDIRDELAQSGFIKRRNKAKEKSKKVSKPLHFVSEDGFHIYVGKNNKQNDELTLRFASGNDLWLHTKDIPGSHVIVKTDGKDVPDTTLDAAANLAAFYSKGRLSSLVPVDYTVKRNVKKPGGAKPGMVIYESHKTVYITPAEDKLLKCVE